MSQFAQFLPISGFVVHFLNLYCNYLYVYYIHLFPGKPAEDEVKLGSLKLKPNTKIMMMGTREESLVGYFNLGKLKLAEYFTAEPNKVLTGSHV